MSLILKTLSIIIFVLYTVSGEANFSMKHSSLTIGGFMQPNIARNLVEHPMNVDKGLCQRFLWIVPKHNPVSFAEMEKVESEFINSVGKKW